jgi:hypothetical protein
MGPHLFLVHFILSVSHKLVPLHNGLTWHFCYSSELQSVRALRLGTRHIHLSGINSLNTSLGCFCWHLCLSMKGRDQNCRQCSCVDQHVESRTPGRGSTIWSYVFSVPSCVYTAVYSCCLFPAPLCSLGTEHHPVWWSQCSFWPGFLLSLRWIGSGRD